MHKHDFNVLAGSRWLVVPNLWAGPPLKDHNISMGVMRIQENKFYTNLHFNFGLFKKIFLTYFPRVCDLFSVLNV